MNILVYLDGLNLIDIFDKITTMIFMSVNNDFCVILSKYSLTDLWHFLYQIIIIVKY